MTQLGISIDSKDPFAKFAGDDGSLDIEKLKTSFLEMQRKLGQVQRSKDDAWVDDLVLAFTDGKFDPNLRATLEKHLPAKLIDLVEPRLARQHEDETRAVTRFRDAQNQRFDGRLDEMIEWAGENYSSQEVEAFNAALLAPKTAGPVLAQLWQDMTGEAAPGAPQRRADNTGDDDEMEYGDVGPTTPEDDQKPFESTEEALRAGIEADRSGDPAQRESVRKRIDASPTVAAELLDFKGGSQADAVGKV